ncbi:MAG: hypothetical protein ACPGVK_01455 [Halocynthiibacter sp.]
MIWVAPVFLAVLLPAYFFLPAGHIVRNGVYLLPLFVWIEFAVRGGRLLYGTVAFVSLAYIGGYCGYLLGGSFLVFKEFLFLVLVCAVMLPVFVTPKWSSLIFLGAAVVSVLLEAVFKSNGPVSIGMSETPFGLIVPFLAVVFYSKRRYGLAVLTFVLALFMLKRVALGAAFAVLSYDVLRHVFYQQKWVLSLLHAGLLGGIVFLGLHSLWVYEWIAAWMNVIFDQPMSANSLTSGRYFATDAFLHARPDPSFWQSMFGMGPGASADILQSIQDLDGKRFKLLHNDILRLWVDYGWFGLGVVLLGGWHAMMQGRLLAFAVLYVGILFLTDNVLTYVVFWLALVFLVRAKE